MRFLVFLVIVLLAWPALAQNPPPGPTNGVTTFPGAAASSGVGSLTATTFSATIASLYVGNATNAASWPASGPAPTYFYVRNLGSTDVAICLYGAPANTCVCPENSAGGTGVGITVIAGAYYGFGVKNGTQATTPLIVSCSGSDIVEIDQ